MKKIIFLFLIVSCKPFGADDNNGSVLFDPPTETFYNQSLSSYDVSTSSINTTISPPFSTTEPIISCNGSNVPTSFIVNSDCSINVVNLINPFPERTIILTGTTSSQKKHVFSFRIGAFTKNCASNSITLTSYTPMGNGSSTNPYIICNKDHFLYYISTLEGQGYAILQKDIDLGSLETGLSYIQNSNLNGLGHKLSYAINPSNLPDPVIFDNLSLLSNIKNSIIKNLELSCIVYGPTQVSCLSKKLENADISNLLINSNSLLSGQNVNSISYEVALDSINKFENILIASRNIASNSFYSLFGLIDNSSLLAQQYSNILIFPNSSTGTNSTFIKISNANINGINASEFNQSLENGAIYSNFNNLYWTKLSNTQMSLKKEVYYVFE